MTAIDAGSRARDVTVYAGGLVAVAEFDGDAPPPPGGGEDKGDASGPRRQRNRFAALAPNEARVHGVMPGTWCVTRRAIRLVALAGLLRWSSAMESANQGNSWLGHKLRA
jgi:hypothetical protein